MKYVPLIIFTLFGFFKINAQSQCNKTVSSAGGVQQNSISQIVTIGTPIVGEGISTDGNFSVCNGFIPISCDNQEQNSFNCSNDFSITTVSESPADIDGIIGTESNIVVAVGMPTIQLPDNPFEGQVVVIAATNPSTEIISNQNLIHNDMELMPDTYQVSSFNSENIITFKYDFDSEVWTVNHSLFEACGCNYNFLTTTIYETPDLVDAVLDATSQIIYTSGLTTVELPISPSQGQFLLIKTNNQNSNLIFNHDFLFQSFNFPTGNYLFSMFGDEKTLLLIYDSFTGKWVVTASIAACDCILDCEGICGGMSLTGTACIGAFGNTGVYNNDCVCEEDILCPIASPFPINDVEICSGNSVTLPDLSNAITPPSTNVTYSWSSSEGFSSSSGEAQEVILTNTNCAPKEVVFTYQITCVLDAAISIVGEFVATVYPTDLSNFVQIQGEGTCLVSLSPIASCGLYITGDSFAAESGETGTTPLTVSYAIGTCGITYTNNVNYVCNNPINCNAGEIVGGALSFVCNEEFAIVSTTGSEGFLNYLLHNGNDTTIGNVYASSFTGVFVNDGTLPTSIELCISAVAGSEQQANGMPDPNGSCYDISECSYVVFLSEIDITFEQTCLESGMVEVTYTITGGAPEYLPNVHSYNIIGTGGHNNSGIFGQTYTLGTFESNTNFSISVNDDGKGCEVTIDNILIACDEVFDLALIKSLSTPGPITINPDATVTFTITVYNQGSVTAQNVEIADYIPSGLILNDDNWDVNGNIATTTFAGPLIAGGNVSVNITFGIDPSVLPGLYTNFAEISAAEDENGNSGVDIDSNADYDPNNDGIIDNAINNEDGDEDDHDIEVVELICDTPTDNPPLMATCQGGINIAFVIDESISIAAAGATQQVANAVNTFLMSLNNPNQVNINISFIEFSTNASYIIQNPTPLDNVLVNNIQSYFSATFNGQSYNPNGTTSWQSAFQLVNNLAVPPDLLLFFTDGGPIPGLEGVNIANMIKCQGTRIFMVGVGNIGITGVPAIQSVSGSIPFNPNLPPDPNVLSSQVCTSDYILNPNINQLGNILAGIAANLCPIFGCTDPCAPDYDMTANTDDGCDPYDESCNQDCSLGSFGGVWDTVTCSCVNEITPVYGCRDPAAFNYNSDANCNDGSCDYGGLVFCPSTTDLGTYDCSNIQMVPLPANTLVKEKK